MKDTSFLKHLFFLILFTIVYLLIDFIIYLPSYRITFIFVILNLFIFFYNPRIGLYVFMPFMLLSDVFSRFNIQSSGAEIASIHTMYFGPFNIFTYMSFLFASVGILYFLIDGEKKIILTKVHYLVFVIFLICFLTAFTGFQNFSTYPREYIGDIAPFINLFLGFIIAGIFLDDVKAISNLTLIFLYTFGARTLIGLIKFFLGMGIQAYILLPFYDPIGAFPLFVIFICLSFLYFGHISRATKYFFTLLIFLSTAFSVLWPGRSVWILLFLGLIFISLFQNSRIKFSYMLKICLLLLIIILTLYATKKELVQYSLWRLSTLQYLIKGTTGPSTTSQRFIEYANAFYKLKEDKSLFLGAGAGSWFDDRYIPFPFRLNRDSRLALAAFGEKALLDQKFFRLHELLPNIFFKSGLLGLFLYFTLIVSLTIEIYKRAKIRNYCFQKAFIIGLYIPILFLLTVGFGSKSLIMAGILLGVLANILKRNKIDMHYG